MTVDASGVLTALLDHAHATGVFEVARLGEFISPPPQALCFALWVDDLGSAPSGHGLADTTPLLRGTARIYHPALHKPESDVELKVAGAADAYLGRLNGAFTLGGLVRNIDLLNEMGEPLVWKFGHATIDKTIYRIADLPIGVVFTTSWTQAE